MPVAVVVWSLLSPWIGCGPRPATTTDPAAAAAAEKASAQNAPASAPGDAVERGRYLVAGAACGECHTPLRMGPAGPEPDTTRLLSGHPDTVTLDPPPAVTTQSPLWMWSQTNTDFTGAFGTSFAINLTPDEATGIGAWTEDIFVKTIKTGRHWGAARPILPPMPWRTYSQLTDDDLKAIYAYLRTVPPIKNRVPDAQPAPPAGAAPPSAGEAAAAPG